MQLDLEAAVLPPPSRVDAAPFLTHDAAVKQLLQGRGSSALDIGCGRGQFTFLLTGLFSRLAGIDPRAERIEAARAAAERTGAKIEFVEGSGEKLPFDDGSFDVVVFSNSLHHIPDCDRAMAEAHRVLSPGGHVYVMEPVAAGSYFEANRLVSDETIVRRDAYKALQRANGFHPDIEFLYRARTPVPGFEQWKAHQIDMDRKRARPFEERESEVRQHFEDAVETIDGKRVLTHLYRVNLLKKAG